MSKEQSCLENAAQPLFAPTAPPTAPPSAPPSYDEAMQHASAAYPSLPNQGLDPYAVPTQPMHMAMMPMPQSAPQFMPSTQAISQPIAPPAPAPRTTIVITSMGRERMVLTCPKCNAQIRTETHEKVKCAAHLLCCLLMFTLPCCCCLPYCFDCCKDVKHKCPNCQTTLGTYTG